MNVSNAQPEAGNASASTKKRNKQILKPVVGLPKDLTISLRKFFILNVITLGVYRIYWAWRVWESVRLQRGINYRLNSFIRSLLLEFNCLVLFPRLEDMSAKTGYKAKYSSKLLAGIYFVLPVPFAIASFLLRNTHYTLLLDVVSLVLSTVLLLPMVDMYNYYTRATKGKFYKSKSNKWIIGFLVLSSALGLCSLYYSRNIYANQNNISSHVSFYESTTDSFSVGFPGKPRVISGNAEVSGVTVSHAVYISTISGSQVFEIDAFKWPSKYDFSKLPGTQLAAIDKDSADEFIKHSRGSSIAGNTEYVPSIHASAYDAQYTVSILYLHSKGYLRTFAIGNVQYYVDSLGASKTNFNSFVNSFKHLTFTSSYTINVTTNNAAKAITPSMPVAGSGNSTTRNNSPSANTGNATLVQPYNTNDCGGPAGTLICPDPSDESQDSTSAPTIIVP